jgi:outer membrane lipoprotein-sorting protein
MHYRFTFVLLSILSVTFSIGTNAQQDAEAKKILDQVSSRTNSYSSIRAEFSYHYKNSQSKEDQTHEGTIILKGNMYKLEFLNTEVYCDGATQWSYMPEVKEVNVTNADQNKKDFFLSNPLELFRVYVKDYKYRYMGEVTEKGKVGYQLDLYPFDLKRPYHRIRITIDKATFQVLKAEVSGKNGDSYEITITSFQTNQKLEDSFFRFEPKAHPGVEVIDLRM